ncbi:MAG: hypothetical protein J5806_10280 [Lentisphaeria bacterium]|nr:hypothetical protein [Lentisphaeria bacterium]
MKIKAGARITETMEVRLLNRGPLGRFDDPDRLRHALTDRALFPQADWTDFGRGSPPVRFLMLAAVLTAGDHGGPLPESTGVFGWNGSGCTAENLRFWQDYIQHGRENGRGGLFVATLPTIPFGEAAIALGLRGPNAYFRTERSTHALAKLIALRPAGLYLVGEVAEDSVCMFLLETSGRQEDITSEPDFPTLESLFVHLEGRNA